MWLVPNNLKQFNVSADKPFSGYPYCSDLQQTPKEKPQRMDSAIMKGIYMLQDALEERR